MNDLASIPIAPPQQTSGHSEGMRLPVMEAFYTIQGEGRHQGRAAYFIRLGGCDVGCVWCDVKESWDVSPYPLLDVCDISVEAAAHPASIVVVTGGEPLLHPLDSLCRELKNKGLRTHLETSGSHPLSGEWDWICLSPKKFKAPLPEVCRAASELKVVIYHPSDFSWAEQYAQKVPDTCSLLLQPEWSKAAAVTPLIVDYVKTHPRWGISLQVHKFMRIP